VEDEMKKFDFKVGDECYVWTSGISITPRLVKVVKVTPTGYFDVKYNLDSDKTYRFRPDGTCMEKYSDRDRIDEMPVAERTAWIEQGKRETEAVKLLQQVKWEHNLYFAARYGKESLQKYADDLQAKLDAAKKAIEAI
jgi:hypothetical protein